MSLALLLTTAAATAVGAAALHAAHGLRKQVTALRTELAASSGPARTAAIPQARSGDAAEIRAAVAEALAEERERELAEARAFWAAQEARDAADASARYAGEGSASALGGLSGAGDDFPPFYVPRQADLVGLESMDLDAIDGLDALDDMADLPEVTEFAEDSPELAAARRRHPSHPDFVPVQTPVVTDHERTVSKLEELAETGTELADVRPGPLGTLDVYVFADGTTLCMTPGHRETAERLADALRAGDAPVLLGGSGVSGAYALTFSCGEESVYILADRVIASH
ncbi:hypothetical protein [Streptomyces xantholiticus]|uniref:hypothetical protein n=1 Tax=Streptomyces xantholiticus TaxID=68285 RepID=UPI001678988F|nr:hypothetical protein [Streptomyces xantholiticus]GGW42599.1 hypothetical protein GCM10010381_29610 [Streptomyces xantholiticus]